LGTRACAATASADILSTADIVTLTNLGVSGAVRRVVRGKRARRTALKRVLLVLAVAAFATCPAAETEFCAGFSPLNFSVGDRENSGARVTGLIFPVSLDLGLPRNSRYLYKTNLFYSLYPGFLSPTDQTGGLMLGFGRLVTSRRSFLLPSVGLGACYASESDVVGPSDSFLGGETYRQEKRFKPCGELKLEVFHRAADAQTAFVGLKCALLITSNSVDFTLGLAILLMSRQRADEQDADATAGSASGGR
jgi:hypothetical protein